MASNDGRERKAEERKDQAADRIGRAGDRLKERARGLEAAGGARRQAGRAARRTGDWLEDGASYLRRNDLHEIRSDVEVRVREYPLLSVGMALTTGFLLGRMLG